MPTSTGHRRLGSADAAKAWTDRLRALHRADHPRHKNRFDTYVNYFAFLVAGSVEHRWSEGVESGQAPFAPLKAPASFLTDLQQRIRTFRESRFIDGIGSAELVRHSFDLLSFLAERVPHEDLERFLAVTRAYIRQNEDDCLAA